MAGDVPEAWLDWVLVRYFRRECKKCKKKRSQLGGVDGKPKKVLAEGHKVTWRIERWPPHEVGVSCSEERY